MCSASVSDSINWGCIKKNIKHTQLHWCTEPLTNIGFSRRRCPSMNLWGHSHLTAASAPEESSPAVTMDLRFRRLSPLTRAALHLLLLARLVLPSHTESESTQLIAVPACSQFYCQLISISWQEVCTDSFQMEMCYVTDIQHHCSAEKALWKALI